MARGIGILLVVYAHAIRGVVLQAGDAPQWAALQDSLIYGFHMPLFFLLAGLFVERSLARSRSHFLPEKLLTIVYPYVLWSTIEWTLAWLASSHVNTPPRPEDLLTIAWAPFHHFWFLYALLLCHLAAWALLPRLWPFGLLIIWPLLLTTGPFIPLAQALSMLPFYAAGILLARARELGRLPAAAATGALAAAAWAAYLLLWSQLAGPEPGGITHRVYEVAAAFAGIVGTLAIARLARGKAGAVLAALGRISMPVFLLHTIFSAGARIVISSALPGLGPAVLVALVTMAGIVGPAAVYLLVVRFARPEWFGFGRVAAAEPRPRLAS